MPIRLLPLSIIALLGGFLACSPPESPSIPQWHTLTLSFEGPTTSEQDSANPFLHYRLMVDFTHAESHYQVRGFYAADGNAAETSADSGSVWKVRFSPPKTGTWTYTAHLHRGDSIALSDNFQAGKKVALAQSTGSFTVVPSDKNSPDFRANGWLGIKEGHFHFPATDQYFVKAGANSPENLLGFVDFDQTYRTDAQNREGEAQANQQIHTFTPHLQDWQEGEPTWQKGKGKALIGALNYLSKKGMNAVYFLTFNLEGDGKDVWMYANPEDFSRFDVSKLAQWEIVFEHMQQKGLLMHVMTQETENETLLDGGNTGPLRKLYYLELIARFGHHPGLIWDLGEENGPNSWAPEGQTTEQRMAMASFIRKHDPYAHPIFLHTLPSDSMRSAILDPLLGYEYLDGISLQQDQREEVAQVVQQLATQSREAGQEWSITMDEIGMWHTGALTDTADPGHPSLTRHALWGSLLSGAAGVEWYFGGLHVHNDLNSEDWRQRDQLWEITANAKVFFETYLPYWEMEPAHKLIAGGKGYCLRKRGEVYALYLFDYQGQAIDLAGEKGSFSVSWFDPWKGGELQNGSVASITGGGGISLGASPGEKQQDWVVLLQKE